MPVRRAHQSPSDRRAPEPKAAWHEQLRTFSRIKRFSKRGNSYLNLPQPKFLQIPGSPMKVFDVTRASNSALFSGVQRLVREAAVMLPPGWKLVRFDPKTSTFRVITSIPEINYRDSRGLTGGMRILARNFFLKHLARRQRRSGLEIPRNAANLARRFYARFLADAYIKQDSRWESGTIWKISDGDHYFSMEILNEADHRAFVRKTISESKLYSSFYVHDLIPLTHPQLFPRQSSVRVLGNFVAYINTVLSASELVANSNATAREFEALRSALSPSSVQTTRTVYPLVKIPDASKARLPASLQSRTEGATGIHLMCVGALDERKNIEVAIRALLILIASGRTATLVVVGDPGTTPSSTILRLLSGLSKPQRDSLILAGSLPQAELEGVYRWADIVLVPSRAEGFGLPLLEAVIRGVPVIASDLQVFREISDHGHVTFFDGNSPAGLAQSILDLVDTRQSRDTVKDLKLPDSLIRGVAQYMSQLLPHSGR